jgi:hypothetical protein
MSNSPRFVESLIVSVSHLSQKYEKKKGVGRSFSTRKKTYRIHTTLEVQIIQNSQEFVATEMI